MKKEIALLILPILFITSGCGLFENSGDLPPETPKIITRKTVQEEQGKTKTENPPSAETGEEPPAGNTPGLSPADPSVQNQKEGKQKYPIFVYPYTIAEDRQNFDYHHIDIVVGDKRYMTQINDWYMNFQDYKDKTVLIEGYYLSINGHHFVGRNGPTCPYCTGGYVDFEFTSDQDFTGYEPASTWIRVYGILREATVKLNDHITAPFYHLEAVKVEKMEQEGMGTITD